MLQPCSHLIALTLPPPYYNLAPTLHPPCYNLAPSLLPPCSHLAPALLPHCSHLVPALLQPCSHLASSWVVTARSRTMPRDGTQAHRPVARASAPAIPCSHLASSWAETARERTVPWRARGRAVAYTLPPPCFLLGSHGAVFVYLGTTLDLPWLTLVRLRLVPNFDRLGGK